MKQFFSMNSSCRLPLNPALLVKGINIQVQNQTHIHLEQHTHLLTFTHSPVHPVGGLVSDSGSGSGLNVVPQSDVVSCLQLCSFFNSNAVPLKLSFQNLDPMGDHINVIFKVMTPESESDLQTNLCDL